MTSVKPAETSNKPTDEQQAPRPSLRARVITRVVRTVVKRWPRRDMNKLVLRARRLFGVPTWMTVPISYGVSYQQVLSTDVCGEWVVPRDYYTRDRVLLYLHGGGYVSCSPRSHRPITAALARLLGSRVFALDYRLAPEAPFPAAVDDASRAFAWLTELGVKPRSIALAGESAGGGLAIATMLRLRANEQPLPGCAACLSPWVDLTGEWNYANTESCAMFRPEDISAFAEQYLNGASPRTPEASPIFADLKGLPPLLIQAATGELLFDEAVRLHEKAERSGVESTLRAYSGVPHAWHMCAFLLPESGAALREIAAFVEMNTR
jgi:epsilon-lactone hydrolase